MAEEEITNEMLELTDFMGNNQAPSEETKTVAETPEGTTGEGAEAQEAVEPEKTYYTPEEMRTLTMDQLDTSRIPPEMAVVYNSMRAAQTRTQQELAEQRQRVEAERLALYQDWLVKQQVQQQPTDPKAKLFNDYMVNPYKIEMDIQQEISKLEQVDPQDTAAYRQARAYIAELNKTKTEFAFQRNQMIEGQRYSQMVDVMAKAAVAAEIPNFETKRVQITEFAKSLGIPDDTLSRLTDPKLQRNPQDAIAITKFLNALYDIASTGKTAEAKAVKVVPMPLERPGSRAVPKEQKETTWSQTDAIRDLEKNVMG